VGVTQLRRGSREGIVPTPPSVRVVKVLVKE
jgi:hypothetical protein